MKSRSSLEYNRRYRAANRERLNVRAKARYAANREGRKEQARLYGREKRVKLLAQRFGVSIDVAEVLDARAAAEACGICEQTAGTLGVERLCIDHDHKTSAIRGILCRSCNLAIGKLGDSADRLAAALRYISK